MTKKKNDLHAIPAEMQAKLDHERKLKAQRSRERLHKNIEFAKKKMEDEFVRAKSDDEFIKDDSTKSDALINPSQKGNDGEIFSQDV